MIDITLTDVTSDNIPSCWPFEEAVKILKSINLKDKKKDVVVFETGYGPSGLPHIGTFGEVLRTNMVRNALRTISSINTKLIAFSDDLDGLRKIPDNIPNPEQLTKYLHHPLSAIPDPFKCCHSFSEHNNKILCQFLDAFGFQYTFHSATKCYKSGMFNDILLHILHNYESIQKIILPTLGQERQKTYSPFLPICPTTGQVLQVPVLEWNAESGTIVYEYNEKKFETPVTDGLCKLQWKVDWAMRWYALDIDYEMCGKDLISSFNLSSQVIKTLGKSPPHCFIYELFLDQNAQKISKSKGNGLSLQDWLSYAPIESLAYFMYQKPKRAKRLYFNIIPKSVDEYLHDLEQYHVLCKSPKEISNKKIMEHAVWHIHAGNPPKNTLSPISFSMLLNLVSACNTENIHVIWKFITRYKKHVTQTQYPYTNQLIQHAIVYYKNFVKPYKKYRTPTEREKEALKTLQHELSKMNLEANPDLIQDILYQTAKTYSYEKTGEWFKALYQILLGQENGPRMGSFIALYGIQETISLIQKILNNNLNAN